MCINYKFTRRGKEVTEGGSGLPSLITRTEENFTEIAVYHSCIIASARHVIGKCATTDAPFLCLTSLRKLSPQTRKHASRLKHSCTGFLLGGCWWLPAHEHYCRSSQSVPILGWGKLGTEPINLNHVTLIFSQSAVILRREKSFLIPTVARLT